MKLTLDNAAIVAEAASDPRTITGLRLAPGTPSHEMSKEWLEDRSKTHVEEFGRQLVVAIEADQKPEPLDAYYPDPLAGFGDVLAREGFLREWGLGESPNETDAATVGDVSDAGDPPVYFMNLDPGGRPKLGRYTPRPDPGGESEPPKRVPNLRGSSDYKTTPAGGDL